LELCWFTTFFAWVSEKEKDWVDRHIHCYVNIAGAHLGVPKAASALMSGEMSDTIFMGAVGTLVEQFIGRKKRRDLWATWGSLWSMLPKGGDALWENIITTTDVNSENKEGHGNARKSDIDEAVESFGTRINNSASHVIELLSTLGGGYNQEQASTRKWHDLSRTPLPHAPNMKIYCLYGVGLETENGYFYKRNKVEASESEGGSSPQVADPPFIVDTTVDDPENNVFHGVRYTDGDASVPLASLGYMCADAWRRPESGLNPSRIPIITREYQHREELTLDDPMRRGPYSGDHVDILGHYDVLTDLMKIVTGHNVDEVKDEIISDIREIAKEINTQRNSKGKRKWIQPLKQLGRPFQKLRSPLKKLRFRFKRK